ncbi:glycosyltransferase family 2 protein [Aridibaculum aurantiacum]|uniref:glycosyltransferase family 2 protein n=1 Tax=Aridibaculum aurantiacum TaxID=2810307 RepID=UPI001A96E0B0|nr:glycosyltransferase family 2 protein [Aridibaculum aurantiacum]
MSVQLSIIIVNYKSGVLTSQCIASIQEQTQHLYYEIIVVDNHSGDNSEEVILSAHPSVIWHQVGYNAGFSRANNAGMRLAKGKVVLLLNPDTIVINNAVERCYERFINSTYAACGVQMIGADGVPQISGNFFMKGGLNHLLPLPYWGNFLKAIALAAKTKKPNIAEAVHEEKVDWITGAFLMTKREVIEKVGEMDEDFFLYAEEVEWCSRIKKAGELCIYGDIRMIHLQGEVISSSTQTEDKTYANLYDKKGLQLIVSNHVRIRKQYGVGWFLFQLLNYSIAVPIFFFASIIHNLFLLKNPLYDWNRIMGLTKNVIRTWQLAPTIISNKPHFYKML